MSKELTVYESFRIDGEKYCIADEMIALGRRNGTKEYKPCGSSNALSSYQNIGEDGEEHFTGYCYSCNQVFNKENFHSSSHAKDYGIEGGIVSEKKTFVRKPKAVALTKKEVKDFIKEIGYESYGYRGIKDEYNRFFGHLTKLNSSNEVLARYYPETSEDSGAWPTGYKCRNHPKDFRYGKIGLTGQGSKLSGQIKFEHMDFRDLLLVGGEEDKTSFYQIWMERAKAKGNEDFAGMPVVSGTTGESSLIQQIRANYDFIIRAENIYLGLDNDDAGIAAMEDICQILPREKIKVIRWSKKDPSSYIHNPEGKDYSRQAIADFYNAKSYVRDGIITSVEADKEIEKELLRPKMSLPPFMRDLQDKMAAGIPLGYWVNWIAESGIGKSTLINEAIRHWVYTSPYKIGILSLELTGAQYMIAMLSREVGKKINLFETPEEAVAFIKQPHVMEARNKLSMTEDGESRFVILDERDGDLEQVKIQCETLVNKHGCRVIIIDPIQDLFEGVSMDLQNSFVKWMKGMLKNGVTFNNVCHVRKGNTSTDKDGNRVLRELSEDDVHGISSVVKSAGANVFMSRDKYAESDIAKNTTYITLGKCRWTGITGRVGSWFYHLDSHTMYDLKTYFSNHPEELEAGYDLDANPFDKGKNKKYTKSNTKDLPVDSFKIDIGGGVVL